MLINLTLTDGRRTTVRADRIVGIVEPMAGHVENHNTLVDCGPDYAYWVREHYDAVRGMWADALRKELGVHVELKGAGPAGTPRTPYPIPENGA